MIIGEIIAERPFEMACVEDDDVIQTLPANAADDVLGIGTPPRAPRCGRAFPHPQYIHPQTAHAFAKFASIDSLTIARLCLPKIRSELKNGACHRGEGRTRSGLLVGSAGSVFAKNSVYRRNSWTHCLRMCDAYEAMPVAA